MFWGYNSAAHLLFYQIAGVDVKGFVRTPTWLVDRMVDKLFTGSRFEPGDQILDAGAGEGAFVDGVLRWCARHGNVAPSIVAVESDPERADFLRQKYDNHSHIAIVCADFLLTALDKFRFIVSNPPYVPITKLTEAERRTYRERFRTAKGRFDLYMLFLERAASLLQADGVLVFVTPEKFLYVETAAPLRQLLSQSNVCDLEFTREDTFPGRVTYPLVTTIKRGGASALTQVTLRDGTTRRSRLSSDGASWLPQILYEGNDSAGARLLDLMECISCGVATGADSVFLLPTESVPATLRQFAYPTIAGRDLHPGQELQSSQSLLVPYDESGLLPSARLGALQEYLREPSRYRMLQGRTCVNRKPWYAFHETPRLELLAKPKILCKDIASSPHFFADSTGSYIPRHSIYYMVPQDPAVIPALLEYLNSDEVYSWLQRHCQRAANGFLRLQSHILKRIPIDGVRLAIAPPEADAVAMSA